ncbi:MAG: hypothetical protein A3C02_01045 [Candidatus Andersenbacteria bacterium RIFCSPHIGHO2_02_FULL_45_11]|uniref:DUF1003 domain-containing protein n=1 Tax=Candidatus Andersenbacteria bacterium RIFCSPHIGHO2_12_FULL_45_11 TaxID=1797281 RepID=A0A1G1WZE5_9BACT|nr:MAG: hypothetical protein A2805_00460 [Candidatus Andersenbacteria bacterium RIFCSPHIGHO2_01_FULL_46_36]OGY33138.1 MAG: hypothetical protein A3D99_01615 [Candidatus Andersenbacteria bacterium RIFCSPHIGHO2_12_FULL_45_11]OGY33162.1 MAG: hypothetical protein A3C02_01045 [Candidatus Andersenbacteria bacterium RIFCSPHIGHO2_02_FULL_45_11]
MEGHSRVRNANAEHRESLTNLERLALFVTTKIGSMKFFFLLLTITIIWVLWNTYAAQEHQFDPFPAFVLWLFCSNILQLLLMPLILIGQNLQGRHSEVRAESDFDLNVRAEKEIKRILAHLEKQDKMSIETLRRIDELHRR